MADTFPIDSLVELQDEYSSVYPLSPTGARGWVRANRECPKIDPEVYIEWDKAHWRYHGELDGWTYAHHFRPVPDVVAELTSSAPQILEETLSGLERCPDCGNFHEPEPDSLEDQFLHTLLEAQESALDAEGYFIVTLTPRRDGELMIYEPQIYTDALTETAREMIEAQLVHVAAQLFDSHMLNRINDLEGPSDEPGR